MDYKRHPCALLVSIGNIYRLWRKPLNDGYAFFMESLDGKERGQCIEWDDPGELVNSLVKCGIVADHQAGFELLRGELCATQ